MPGVTLNQQIALLYQQQSRRVLATLIRLLGDFELAEEAMQEAFSVAVEVWPQQGIPAQPRAWLISTARFKAIDKMRRQRRYRELLPQFSAADAFDGYASEGELEDDQLRLIFTCCHPALSEQARVALTLREMCGLSTEQVAKAFLISPQTLAQRIVRAKRKIKQAKIPYEVPQGTQLNERLATVRQVLYLVFSEGYYASSGERLLDTRLMDEALRLTEALAQLFDTTETLGLLSLMLFQSARRSARMNAHGDLITLENQDRSCWDAAQIGRADELLRELLPRPDVGSYTFQAAIAGLHASAPTYAQTDWREILAFYDLLLERQQTPVVALNRAVAIAMGVSLVRGLEVLEQLNTEQQLDSYSLFHACKADVLRRMGSHEAAAKSYQRALTLTEQAAEQKFLQRRLASLSI